MKIVTVVPLKKGVWTEDLTYFTGKDIPTGSIVTVPLRSKNVLGLAVSTEEVSDAKMNIKGVDFNLRKIIEVKEHSVFLKEYLDSTLAAAKYFATGKNNAVTTLIPAVLREEYDTIAKIKKEKMETVTNTKREIGSEKLLFQAPFEDRVSYYKTLIRGSFADKKSVFFVLPTERDIKDFKESISKGIEQFTFVLHSGLSKKKILEQFEKIMTTTHPILILGTAPFLSVPREDLGTIILEHESSTSYKMFTRPHFDLRVFTEIFAANIDVKFILGDTLLRFETIARKDSENMGTVHPLSFRINFSNVIVTPPDRGKNSKFKIFSDQTLEDIQKNIEKKKSVFIFTLRKGLATMTTCSDCNNMVSCDRCGAPVVLYLSSAGKKRMFVCNRCQRELESDTACKVCGSWNLMPLGIGTDTVHEEIKTQFPKVKIFQLDKEAAKNARGADKIVAEFEKTPGSILVGTEMALFYLKEQLPLSIIASFDSLWSIPNFKMSEKIIQLMIGIIEKTLGKLIVQTKNETDPAILAVKSENLLSFVREELEDRKNLHYPPFKRFIKITHLGDKEKTIRARKALEEIFEGYEPEIFSGFVARLAGKYATNALIKIDTRKWSLPELSTGTAIDEVLLEKLLSLPPTFEIFVDPEDLL